MDKIWIVINNNSYRNSKYKVYKTQTQLLKAISADKNQEVLEFDLVSKTKTSDFFKQRERDNQLRAVLGELESKEEGAIELINLYSKIAPDGKTYRRGYGSSQIEYTEKSQVLETLKKYQCDKKAFSSVLVSRKDHFMRVSHDVEWYKALLKCHNFRDEKHGRRVWDRINKVYITPDIPQEIIDNFKEAKKQLRKK